MIRSAKERLEAAGLPYVMERPGNLWMVVHCAGMVPVVAFTDEVGAGVMYGFYKREQAIEVARRIRRMRNVQSVVVLDVTEVSR